MKDNVKVRKRKTAEEYKAEYSVIIDKKQIIEQQIKNRAIQLCKKFPDIEVTGNLNAKDFKEVHESNSNNFISIQNYINIIETIEKHNENTKQTSLYDEYNKKTKNKI